MVDPNKTFIILTISRKEICDMVCDALDTLSPSKDRPQPDDDRFTDDLCDYIASQWCGIYTSGMDEDMMADHQRALIMRVALAYFY
jgi:hypothetical protein